MEDGPDDLWSRFAMSVFRLNGLLVLAGEGITGPLGQSSARWQVIGRVAFEAKTVAQLAREIGNARQSVQRVTDQLERAGLVTYRPHPVDGRTQLVELTSAGRQVLEAIYTQQLSWSERIVEQLNPVQLERTVRALDRVSGVLEADLPATKPDSQRRTS
jgi:DNA-binding MarR family transcriptional regulator